MSNECMTTIRLPNGKRSDLGRLGLCVTIDNEPECFEFTHEELMIALDLVKAHADKFNEDDEGYSLDLFFAEQGPLGETKWIGRKQLGIAETFMMNDFVRLAGIK